MAKSAYTPGVLHDQGQCVGSTRNPVNKMYVINMRWATEGDKYVP